MVVMLVFHCGHTGKIQTRHFSGRSAKLGRRRVGRMTLVIERFALHLQTSLSAVRTRSAKSPRVQCSPRSQSQCPDLQDHEDRPRGDTCPLIFDWYLSSDTWSVWGHHGFFGGT